MAGQAPGGKFWLYGGLGLDSTGTTRTQLDDLWQFDPTTRAWTWLGGSNTGGSGTDAVFGTKGTPSASNIPGGRAYSNYWTDASANLWLFAGNLSWNGGEFGPETNDLWRYQPSINEWTWVGGSDTGTGGIGAGNVGVYGTLGIPSPGNYPGTRSRAYSCTDPAGNFWLYGGGGVDSVGNDALLNDLWVYSPASGEWTWVAGNKVAGTGSAGWPPVEAAQGVPAPANTPGGRQSGSCWFDSGGNLWLFGGQGSGNGGWNDLWEYNPTTTEWAWEGGSNQPTNCTSGEPAFCGQPGVYGSLGSPAAINQPGARDLTSSWVDEAGNLWLFGGIGFDENGNYGELNDLWEFSPTTRQWTWQGGNTSIASCTPAVVDELTCGDAGVYGTKGTPDSANTPGGRDSAMGWTDTAGNLWLFGGEGYDGLGQYGNLNDLWMIQSAASALTQAAIPQFSLAAGTFDSPQTVSISDSTAGATIYFTADGTAPTLSSQIYSGSITVSSTAALEAIAVANGYAVSKIATSAYVFPPTFQLAASPGTLQLTSTSSGTVTVSVKPVNGFNSAVSLECSGLPFGATCTFNPATVTPDGTDAATTQLTISASASASSSMPTRSPFLPGATLALAGSLLFWRKRLSIAWWTCALLLSGSLLAISACGGSSGRSSGGTNPPPPTQATVTVTATSGSLSQTATIALTIHH